MEQEDLLCSLPIQLLPTSLQQYPLMRMTRSLTPKWFIRQVRYNSSTSTSEVLHDPLARVDIRRTADD